MADNTVAKIIDTLLRADLVEGRSRVRRRDLLGTQLLFRFVAAALERRSLGIASHWPFDAWGIRTLSKSGRALIAGERDLVVLADFAQKRMPLKIPELRRALVGRFGEHHASMLRLHLDHIDHLGHCCVTAMAPSIVFDQTPEGDAWPLRSRHCAGVPILLIRIITRAGRSNALRSTSCCDRFGGQRDGCEFLVRDLFRCS
jgi:hypothetical protein